MSRDDEKTAAKVAEVLKKNLQEVKTENLSGGLLELWQKAEKSLAQATEGIRQAEGLTESREAFLKLSEPMIALTKRLDSGGGLPVLLFHCPMAFDDRGADWLQPGRDLENPYFGSVMFRCGELKETIAEGQEEE